MPRLLPSACLAAACAALTCFATPVNATAVDVMVADASGKPLPGAVVFLESKEARVAARPGAVVDVVTGATAGAGESVHLLEIAGIALLWLLARRDEASPARLLAAA